MATDSGTETGGDVEHPVNTKGEPLRFTSKILEGVYRKAHPNADLGAFESPQSTVADNEVHPYDQKVAQPGIHPEVSRGATKVANEQVQEITSSAKKK